MATIQNLVIDQGCPYSFRLTVKDPVGDPIDLTGATIKAYIRRHPKAVLFYTFESAVVGDPTDGVIELTFDFATIDPNVPQPSGRYIYDVVVSANGTPYKVVEGLVTFNATVSQDLV
jgi:hypothetical protein